MTFSAVSQNLFVKACFSTTITVNQLKWLFCFHVTTGDENPRFQVIQCATNQTINKNPTHLQLLSTHERPPA